MCVIGAFTHTYKVPCKGAELQKIIPVRQPRVAAVLCNWDSQLIDICVCIHCGRPHSSMAGLGPPSWNSFKPLLGIFKKGDLNPGERHSCVTRDDGTVTLGNGRKTVSRVLFRRRKLTEPH